MTVWFLRWFTLGVLLVGLGLATEADSAKSRGLTIKLRASEARDAPVEAEVELYSKSYALVIGIDDYTAGWPRLGQAVKDARNVAKALEGQGFEVTLKTNLDSRSLQQTFQNFFIDKGKDPDARLFVWYAGHGHTDVKGEGYLIPTDGALERDRGRFLRAALSLRDFGKFVRYADSKHVFTIFDSCFAGTIFNVARAAPPPQITRITTRPVRQFLTSGDAGQTVSDDGIFAKLFIEALQGERRADGNGDGYLTASEMGSFLDAKMSNYTKNRQTPRYGKLSSPEFDKGDFVFALSKAAAKTATAIPRRDLNRPLSTSPVIRPAGKEEIIFWQSIQNSDDPEMFAEFQRQFPSSRFAGLAKLKVKELQRKQQSAAAEVARRARIEASKPIQIRAADFQRSKNIGVGISPYGAGVILNNAFHWNPENLVEYDFEVARPGRYDLQIEYAALESRPVTISLNGEVVKRNGLEARTGGWETPSQIWRSQIRVILKRGSNTLRLFREGYFPHVRNIKFVPLR